MFKRSGYNILLRRLSEKRRFIQVLSGPRQTGKTTIARQVLGGTRMQGHYASADEPTLRERSWIEQEWEAGRMKTRPTERPKKAVLVLDEIQKITGWSETVKRLWDEDTATGTPLYVVILGSSRLLVQQGLTESLAGRFEIIPVTHWSFGEMKKAFGWNLDQYIFYGGYPGAAELIQDRMRWANYIVDSLTETTISRDILLMTRVDKPALLRRLFQLGCTYSGQVLAYQKMLGQLQDAGNTTTLAQYLDLLENAGMLMGLQKYAGQQVRQRASSPKLQVLNAGLMTAQSPVDLKKTRSEPDRWGRLVESAVGASLANGIRGTDLSLFYWSSRNREVDFVLCRGEEIAAIEVKSGRNRPTFPGTEAFAKAFRIKRKLLVGTQGIPLEDFLLAAPQAWLE
ncbi:MAG: ATP-binding protein [Deltaproteobacteria bacterium]|nr:ATP-binding protein [Deltaproteobacteria bacterium]